ncbi:MAG: glycosyltransferase family 4 protein [Marinosulfonomonas sp.]|nr:glycosyltransferase family 4 protein [Marinosulfonomonas sp.]
MREILLRFDQDNYLNRYPDVAQSKMTGLVHYLRYGRHEGRVIATPDQIDTQDGRKERDPKNLVNSLLSNLPNAVSKDLFLYKYGLIDQELDPDYYARRYSDLQNISKDLSDHFLRFGGKEGRNPSPYFDTKAYFGRYPEVKKSNENPLFHYLAYGKKNGYWPGRFAPADPRVHEISQELAMGPDELINQVEEIRRDVIERFQDGELGEMFAKAVAIDPLVGHAKLSVYECGIHPLRTEQQVERLSATLRLRREAEIKTARAVVLIPWNHAGGATRLAGHLTKALAAQFGQEEVLVVVTDKSVWECPQWFPDGCRKADFAASAENLSPENRRRVIFEFLRSLNPEVVINVNSGLFWEMIYEFGTQLRDVTRVFTYYFCNEKNALGDWGGYPIRHFQQTFELLDAVLLDSHALKEELTSRYMLGSVQPDKIRVLDTPTDDLPPFVETRTNGQNKQPVAFWAGRFDRQKRLDIVYQIARKMPDVQFRLWGEPKLDQSFKKLKKPGNVRHEGTYSNFADLPLEEADFWLYTSEWDGVPNMLIEVAASGIPLVGSLSGGTGEVLKKGYSYPVDNIDDVSGFVAEIRQLLSDPAEAERRAGKLRQFVCDQRKPLHYRTQLVDALKTGSDL